MGSLRKLIAIALLAVFSLPFASTLFALAPKSDTNLPACCRRDGKHHCMEMATSGVTQSEGKRFSAPLEKCPYCPGTVTANHGREMLNASSALALLASFSSPAVVVAQTESKRRISRDRSRQKRGPPDTFLSHLS